MGAAFDSVGIVPNSNTNKVGDGTDRWAPMVSEWDAWDSDGGGRGEPRACYLVGPCNGLF
jgi:hypothetical protein